MVFSSQAVLICSTTGTYRQLLGRPLSSCLVQWQMRGVSEIWLLVTALGSAAIAARSSCDDLFQSSTLLLAGERGPALAAAFACLPLIDHHKTG